MTLRRLFVVLIAVIAVMALSAATTRAGQPDERPRATIIRGGTIATMSSAGVIEGGELVLRNGNIAAVRRRAPGDRPRRNARLIDAAGKFVTPGLIDAWTDLGTASGGRSQAGAASHRAADALNGFDRHAFDYAIRNGVTAVAIEPAASRGIVGAAALVRLTDPGRPTAAVAPDISLVARLGRGTTGPFGRLTELAALRKAFDDAKKYREAWEIYHEELEQYLKDLKAGKTVTLKKEKPSGRPPPTAQPTERPRRGRRGRRPRPRPPPRGASAQAVLDWLNELQAGQDADAFCCDEPHDESESCPEDEPEPVEDEPAVESNDEGQGVDDLFFQDARSRPARRRPSDKKKDDDKLKKPKRPGFDANKEVLVRALKRELPIRIEAHRPADILNVLEIASDFGLDAAIEGASGARHVADELSRADLSVILGPQIGSARFDNSHLRDVNPANAAILDAAGVPVVIGSGLGRGAASQYLRHNAALASGHGLDREAALAAVTINAARACGAADKIGSLERGKSADVVIWSGHPFAPDTVVEYVFVNGREVYRRP